MAVQSEGTITGSNIPSKWTISTSNASGHNNQQLAFNSAAHLDVVLQSVATTLTAGCNGAGSSLDAGSTDLAGGLTGQTAAATTCTVTFGVGFTSAAQHCVVSGETSPITSYTQTLTTLVVNFASTSNYKWKWICMGT
jgi:CBS domain containing-hemolysin-like protein